jgi:hypothetical protein
MTDLTTRHPGENEYLAAACGLHEQTISPALPAVGDFVSGCSAGRTWSGYVQQVEPGRMVVEASGCWLVVDPADITH